MKILELNVIVFEKKIDISGNEFSSRPNTISSCNIVDGGCTNTPIHRDHLNKVFVN